MFWDEIQAYNIAHNVPPPDILQGTQTIPRLEICTTLHKLHQAQAIRAANLAPTKTLHAARQTHAFSRLKQLDSPQQPLIQLRDPATGILHKDLPTLDRLSWQPRQFTLRPPPALPAGAHRLLEWYALHTPAFPSLPIPTPMETMQTLLNLRDSAPGIDGVPYSFYQVLANTFQYVFSVAPYAIHTRP